MNVNSVQNVQTTSQANSNNSSASVTAALQNGDFTAQIQQILAQSNQTQKTDALRLLTGEQNAEEDVNDELMKLLTQYSAVNMNLGGDNQQLIETLMGNTDLQNNALSSVLTTSSQDSADLLSQLLGGQTQSGSDLMSLLTNSQQNGSSDLLTQLLGGQNDTDNSMLTQLLASMNSSSDSSESLLTSVLGGDTSTANLAGMLSAFSDENDDGAISLAGAIPLNALYELAKINSKTADTTQTADFSQMSTGEKVQALKTAIINGEVTVDEDTDIADVITQLSSNYKLADSVNKAKQALSENTDGTAAELYAGAEKTYDYSEISAKTSLDSSADATQILTQTADSISRAVSDGVEKFSVKLNPEGLGEIIVKMEKSADGIVVNMIASSSKTAEILNNQLTNLQASLNHYNAQVNPAAVTEVSASNSSDNGYAFSQQMADQGFANQSQQQNSQGHYYRTYSENDDAVSQAAQKLSENGALNVYA